MAKWFGKIGYGLSTETAPGVWEEVITEREYYGELVRSIGRTQGSEKLNDDIKINNDISIVADPFARENFYSMKYITYEGIKWKVSSVDASQYPRLVITMGEVYNG